MGHYFLDTQYGYAAETSYSGALCNLVDTPGTPRAGDGRAGNHFFGGMVW